LVSAKSAARVLYTCAFVGEEQQLRRVRRFHLAGHDRVALLELLLTAHAQGKRRDLFEVALAA
jgi:uncharacterized protein (UPF0276 family)